MLSWSLSEVDFLLKTTDSNKLWLCSSASLESRYSDHILQPAIAGLSACASLLQRCKAADTGYMEQARKENTEHPRPGLTPTTQSPSDWRGDNSRKVKKQGTLWMCVCVGVHIHVNNWRLPEIPGYSSSLDTALLPCCCSVTLNPRAIPTTPLTYTGVDLYEWLPNVEHCNIRLKLILCWLTSQNSLCTQKVVHYF